VIFELTILMKVGDTLFAVPKSGFDVPGTIFEAMFSLPSDEDSSDVEGYTEERPIILGGIEDVHFKGFLAALHASWW